MSVPFGKVATDKITGFKGVAVSRTEYIAGCARVGLQSKTLKDGMPQALIYIDELMLKENNLATTPKPSKWIGQVVTDSVTGVKGTVTSYTSYVVQEPRVGIQPKGEFEGKPIESFMMDISTLVEYKAAKAEAKTPARAGGPGDRAPMHRSAPRA